LAGWTRVRTARVVIAEATLQKQMHGGGLVRFLTLWATLGTPTPQSQKTESQSRFHSKNYSLFVLVKVKMIRQLSFSSRHTLLFFLESSQTGQKKATKGLRVKASWGILSNKVKKKLSWCSRCGTAETNPTRNHEVAGSIPGLTQWFKDRALL